MALIFLPLNSATSFLGMNLKQLNGGLVGLDYFITIAVLAGAFAVIVLAVERMIQNMWDETRKALAYDNGRMNDEEANSLSMVRIAKRLLSDQDIRLRIWWRNRGRYWFHRRLVKRHEA